MSVKIQEWANWNNKSVIYIKTQKHHETEIFDQASLSGADSTPSCPGFSGTRNQRPGGLQVVSPEIAGDNSVTFRLYSEDAQSVAVNGSWMGTGETLQMKKGSDGIWTAGTEALEPSMYHYNFVLDGVSILDPGNPKAMRDGTFKSA